MIADMLIDKVLQPIVTELFIRVRKLNNFFAFITQHFVVPKNIRLNSTNYFIMKIPINHSSDIDLKDVMNLNKKIHGKSTFFFSQ